MPNKNTHVVPNSEKGGWDIKQDNAHSIIV